MPGEVVFVKAKPLLGIVVPTLLPPKLESGEGVIITTLRGAEGAWFDKGIVNIVGELATSSALVPEAPRKSIKSWSVSRVFFYLD